MLLIQRNQLEGNFHTQVSSGNHDTVSYVKDGIEVIIAFLVFNLGNYFNVRTSFISQDPLDLLDIGSSSDKTGGDEINTVTGSETDVLFILFGDKRHGQHDTRQINALLSSDRPAVHDFAGQFILALGLDSQGDLAVIDQDLLARIDILVDFRTVNVESFLIADNFLLDYLYDVAFDKINGTVFHFADSDLRALGIQHDSDVGAKLLVDLMYSLDLFQFFLMVAV